MDHRINIGTHIGEYRIEAYVGAGGMGEVYRATHAKLGRVAAVKVLTRAAATPDFTTRFFNEARIQAHLQHPHIATVYDFLEHDARACLIMEYVAGESLCDLAARLTIDDTLLMFRQVVEAVAYIHRHGIVHRDIKAGNVKLAADGSVKLLDFGIAKTAHTPGVTQAGSVVGTLEYLAPEQLKGSPADARSDIWALGVLLYELTTGRLPFESAAIGELLGAIDHACYTPPANLNPAATNQITRLIARCLQRDPAARYQTAEQLLIDLDVSGVTSKRGKRSTHDTLSGGSSAEARSANDDSSIAPASWSQRKRLFVAGGAAACVVALLAVVLVIGALLLGEPSPLQTQSPSTPTTALVTREAKAAARMIEIDVAEGRADVFRENVRVGTTPYALAAQNGERISLRLKRDGFTDKPIDFSVTESKRVYTFSMNR